jgi:hypothetical protein
LLISTPEGKVKQFINKQMKEWYPDATYYAPPGGPFGRNGFPDRMWFIRANEFSTVVVAIEAKAIGNETPTELQRKTLVALARQGVVAAVVVGKDLDHMERVRDEIGRRIEFSSRI